jgi:hypothetical protein
MATFIPADATQPETTLMPATGQKFTPQELETAVGGSIEKIELPDGRVMVMNEVGKLQGMAKNDRASALVPFQSAGEKRAWLAALATKGWIVIHLGDLPIDDNAPSDWIAGDGLLCQPTEL